MKNNYRYEKKFYFPNFDKKFLEGMIKLHPYGFREVFNERKVNSIYYDTADTENFWDNENGHPNREKIRVRWYGNENFPGKDPMVEIKIKRGEVGYKILESYPEYLSETEESDDTGQMSPAKQVSQILKNTYPILHVSYDRKYFSSFDNKFRVTLDSNISYEGLQKDSLRSLPFLEEGCVIELKYGNEDSAAVQSVISYLNSHGKRVDRFSKYARGIVACYE